MVNDNLNVNNIIDTDLYCDFKSFDLNRYEKVLNKLSMFGKFTSSMENSLTKNLFFCVTILIYLYTMLT